MLLTNVVKTHVSADNYKQVETGVCHYDMNED
jgi:hypothetical protein